MPSLNAQQLFDLAGRHRRERRPAEAEAAYRQVLALEPNRIDAIQALAQLAYESDRVIEAMHLLERVVALAPGQAEGPANLGIMLASLGRYDEAIELFRRALGLRPGMAAVHNNLGNALRETGRFDEAAAEFQRALDLQPDYAAARWNLSFILLARGDFERGWPAYEARLAMRGFPSRKFDQPMWDGSDPRGRSLLLHAEQGLGDTFQFIRYAPMVAARGARIMMLCPPELRRLLEIQSLGVERWITDGEPAPAFDVHCPLLSLPGRFGTRLGNIPNRVPYIQPDPTQTNRWRSFLATTPGALKAGLVWAGSPFPVHNRKRSMSLTELAPLAGIPNVTFISLQKGAPSAEAASPPAGMRLIDRTSDLHDFADTAALIGALDLVITIDTGVAHLAGAMGRPTWTLLPFVPDWRWFHDRADSPWYPTMRLFRQPKHGDWRTPILQVADALRRL